MVDFASVTTSFWVQRCKAGSPASLTQRQAGEAGCSRTGMAAARPRLGAGRLWRRRGCREQPAPTPGRRASRSLPTPQGKAPPLPAPHTLPSARHRCPTTLAAGSWAPTPHCALPARPRPPEHSATVPLSHTSVAPVVAAMAGRSAFPAPLQRSHSHMRVRRPTSRQRRPPVFRRLGEERTPGRRRGRGALTAPRSQNGATSLCPFTPATPSCYGACSSARPGAGLQLPASRLLCLSALLLRPSAVPTPHFHSAFGGVVYLPKTDGWFFF